MLDSSGIEADMTKPVLARLTIALIDEAPFWKWEPLTFRFWLPLREEDALTANEGDVKLRFWIDKQCLQHLAEVNLDEISRYANIFVGKMNVEVSGMVVSDPLADVIIKLPTEHNWLPEHIGSTYDPALI